MIVTKDGTDVSRDCYCGTQGIVVHYVSGKYVDIAHYHPNTGTHYFGEGLCLSSPDASGMAAMATA